ncbi:TonB-dependent receptor plug domain-containing protein [Xanthomonas campestris]|uniref:TonB-dependent receptor plug domain-containing protein n=1 Tax=Xanthomonas campestris TaxID=339 RepID=UPI001F14A02E|nr:Plug domain-containing protein [Xanthomonas campestris]
MPITDIRIASGLRRAPLCLCLSLALASTLAGPALAQQTTASPPARTSDDGIFSLDRMIVTGAGQAQSQFEASYAITSMTAEQIDKLAPLNLTSLIGSMPGIYAESTGGEVQNVYRIRGIPDEGSFAVIQEDGISPYPDNNGYFYKTEGLVRPDLMVESVETVRGGPSPIFASNAAAIVNFVPAKAATRPKAQCAPPWGIPACIGSMATGRASWRRTGTWPPAASCAATMATGMWAFLPMRAASSA